MTLDDALRALVREEVREAVADALDDLDLEPDAEEEPIRSRLWRLHPETRLPRAEVAEALGVSERTVRRHASGETKAPTLPMRDGPTGRTTTARELRAWIKDAEAADRFRAAS